MSEIEESSVIDLESIAQQEVKKRAFERRAKAQLPIPPESTPAGEPAKTPEREIEPQAIEPIVKASPAKRERTTAPKRRSRVGNSQSSDMAKKHEQERRALQRNFNDLVKKRERDIRDLMEIILKDHYEQVDKEREDYLAVLNGLKNSLEGQSKEITTSCQQVVTTAAQDEVDRMVNWFHDEFMQELTSKSQQYEELKLSSENQVNKMTEENSRNSQKIMMLDEKIKELALHLPEDVRKELFEELGLEYLEIPAQPAKEEKRKRKGMLSRLSQLFKRHGKAKSKPVQVKPKQAKGQHRRTPAETVIAR